ncbi:MAG: hypothetical protein M9924_18285 [Rhizobiaceae bacterium]|nr:hypothetical protein [Rhizobiaceae bacterium]
MQSSQLKGQVRRTARKKKADSNALNNESDSKKERGAAAIQEVAKNIFVKYGFSWFSLLRSS